MATRIIPLVPEKSEILRPFMNTAKSEWTKLVTHRRSQTMLLLAAVLTIGISALFAWGVGISWADWNEADRAAFDPLQSSMMGAFFAGIISLVIAANIVTNEYSSGMIRQTFTVTTNRPKVLFAKMAVAAGYLILPMMILTFAGIWIGQVVLASYDVPTANVFGSDFWTIFGVGISGIYYPLLTVAIAFMLKSSAATIATVMMTMFFPALFGGLFPRVVQERVLALLPGNAIDALTLGHLNPDFPQYLDKPLAGFVAVVWLVVLTGLAMWNLNRRDVG